MSLHRAAATRLGRELTAGELAVDLAADDRLLEREKEELRAAIEAEKARAVRDRVRRGRAARLRVTGRMVAALERLYAAGRAAAVAEMARLGVEPPRGLADPPPELESHLAALRAHLASISWRVEVGAADAGGGVGLASVADRALERALVRRVPGSLAAAADLVSGPFLTGLAAEYGTALALFGGWTYSAIMDAATCAVCGYYDGHRFDTWDAIQAVLPGGGPNPACYGRGRCRCRPVPEPAGEPTEVPPPRWPVGDLGRVPEGELVDVAPHTYDVSPTGASRRWSYEVADAAATTYRGVRVIVERSDDLEEPARVVAAVRAHLAGLPDGVAARVPEVRVHAGHNPADEFWRERYPGFGRALATGGPRGIAYWAPDPTQLREDRTFDHELGHVIGDRGGPPAGEDWVGAQAADKVVSARYRRKLHTSEALTLGGDAVSEYGANALNEDWAESVRLYLTDRRRGRIGAVVDQRRKSGIRDVRFADVFPARARILDARFGALS